MLYCQVLKPPVSPPAPTAGTWQNIFSFSLLPAAMVGSHCPIEGSRTILYERTLLVTGNGQKAS